MLLANLLRFSKALLIFASLTAILACCQNEQELRFNKGQWNEFDNRDWPVYPHRDRMLNDLVKNHKLTGLTYRQLIDLLGKPDNFVADDSTVSYEILTEFGWNIDPSHGKTLDLVLGADSTVTAHKISEWNRN